MKGPSTSNRKYCLDCDYYNPIYNGGINLHPHCNKVDKYIDGTWYPGQASLVVTPEWCPFLKE